MIEISQVSKSFKGQKVVNNLTLTVNEGEIVGLLGANGAGKSTTLNMVLGFLTPDAGNISINGLDPQRQTQEVRKQI
ncbi:MAG: ATP-binding cassette domain-containing protein [Chryseotalea sp.]